MCGEPAHGDCPGPETTRCASAPDTADCARGWRANLVRCRPVGCLVAAEPSACQYQEVQTARAGGMLPWLVPWPGASRGESLGRAAAAGRASSDDEELAARRVLMRSVSSAAFFAVAWDPARPGRMSEPSSTALQRASTA
eukprot:205985-Rhodomonas_salina.1